MSGLVWFAQDFVDDLCVDADGTAIPGCFVSDVGDEMFLPSDPAEVWFGSVAYLVILAVIVAGAIAAWRWHFATKMADRRGIDRTEAGIMGVLDERGLAATYVQPVRERPVRLQRPTTLPASEPSVVASPKPEPATVDAGEVFPRTGAVEPVAQVDAVDEIEARLARLADLEDRGVISSDEAAARRTEILGEI
jgi:hypothetical protein